MKKFISILLLCPLLISGCNKDKNIPRGKGIFTQSYIHYYISGQFGIRPIKDEWEVSLDGEIDKLPCPELAEYELEKIRYREIAERNGDLSFNGTCRDDPDVNNCAADNYNSISIVSNIAWDAAHPAGMPLDEIAIVQYLSYDPFIKNGYENILEFYIDVDGTKKWYATDAPNIEKYVTALTESDMRMVKDNRFRFWFTTPPADPTVEHTLTVTLTTTEGKVYTATGTGIPPVKKPE